MVIDGTEYEIKEHTLVAISPWMITDITAVESTLQLIKIVYDYTYIKNLLSHMIGLADNGSDMLGHLNMQPCCSWTVCRHRMLRIFWIN